MNIYFYKIKIVWVIDLYLHLGGDEIVNIKDIVAIMDIEKTTLSPLTREFLKMAEEEGFIKTIIDGEIPKSFIVAYKKGMQVIYLSPLSVTTLYRRYKKLEMLRRQAIG